MHKPIFLLEKSPADGVIAVQNASAGKAGRNRKFSSAAQPDTFPNDTTRKAPGIHNPLAGHELWQSGKTGIKSCLAARTPWRRGNSFAGKHLRRNPGYGSLQQLTTDANVV
jgi:hypothetical protein